jgi:DNA-binding XRE family transcriptional regulator
MNKTLEETMLPPSRFSDSAGGVKIAQLSEELALDQAMIGKTLGKSRQTISHYFQERDRYIRPTDPDVRAFWTKLDHVFTLLLALTDESKGPDEIRRWLHTRNKALQMERPVDFIYRADLDSLKTLLMDVLTGAHGG